jgi:hypothetical protein
MRYDHLPEIGRLKKLGRIAIWNKARIIVAISMAIWLADVALLIYGEDLLQITGNLLYTW